MRYASRKQHATRPRARRRTLAIDVARHRRNPAAHPPRAPGGCLPEPRRDDALAARMARPLSWRRRRSPSWQVRATHRMTRSPCSRRSSGSQPWRTSLSGRKSGNLRTRSLFICPGRGCEPDRIRLLRKALRRRRRMPRLNVGKNPNYLYRREKPPTRVLRLAEVLCRHVCNSPQHAPPPSSRQRAPCAAAGLPAGVLAFLFVSLLRSGFRCAMGFLAPAIFGHRDMHASD